MRARHGKCQGMGVTMADEAMRTTIGDGRRRGRPPGKPWPQPSRKMLLDAAKRDARQAAYGSGQSGDLFPSDCGSHPAPHRWYCLIAKPQMERVAAAELRRQGFVAFVPMQLRWRGRGPHTRPVACLAVPRYLFVRFDIAADDWPPIVNTRGVHRLISFAPERPAPVRRGVIEAIAADMEAALGLPDPTLTVQAGDRGHVASGQFAAFPATVQGVRPDGALIVTITIFGRAAPIVLEPGAFRPSPEAPP